jgi:hypothetical protein
MQHELNLYAATLNLSAANLERRRTDVTHDADAAPVSVFVRLY